MRHIGLLRVRGRHQSLAPRVRWLPDVAPSLRFSSLTCCAIVGGCAFGGGEGDPSRAVDLVSAAVDGGAARSDPDAAPMRASLDASAGEVRRVDAAAAGRLVDSGTRDAGGGSACKPPAALPVCEPVVNTGCAPLMQCDLDPTGKEQAGRCVFWILALAGCAADGFTESCDATNTCVAGRCRKLCYCDRDCPAAQHCTGTAPGPVGSVRTCQ